MHHPASSPETLRWSFPVAANELEPLNHSLIARRLHWKPPERKGRRLLHLQSSERYLYLGSSAPGSASVPIRAFPVRWQSRWASRVCQSLLDHPRWAGVCLTDRKFRCYCGKADLQSRSPPVRLDPGWWRPNPAIFCQRQSSTQPKPQRLLFVQLWLAS